VTCRVNINQSKMKVSPTVMPLSVVEKGGAAGGKLGIPANDSANGGIRLDLIPVYLVNIFAFGFLVLCILGV
jgi:hypothetical protein